MPNRSWVTIELELGGKIYHSEMVSYSSISTKLMHYRALAKSQKQYWQIFICKQSKGYKLKKR